GIPREREQWVLKITNQNFGIEDPDFQLEGDTPEQRLAFITEAFQYLDEVMEDRRRNPREDLSAVLAHAKLPDGDPPPKFELYSLYFLVMVAGHDTTRNAISSGLRAFLEHPGELEKLRRDPSLVRTAADEIVRWTTPVNHFARTATQDYELRRRRIRAGDPVALSYGSATGGGLVSPVPAARRSDG